jgi:hypothetical protein
MCLNVFFKFLHRVTKLLLFKWAAEHGRGAHAVLQDLHSQLFCDRRFVYTTRVLFYDPIWIPLKCLLDRDHWISAIEHAMHAACGTGMSVWDLEM